MLYIVGTEITTKKKQFDPRQPNQNLRVATWLPVDLNWILGRISKTPDADTVDYMFYCADNPQRTHVTTFETCEQADKAIAAARNENIVDTDDSSRKEVNTDEKFSQVASQLNRREAPQQRRGGRPGSLGRRMGR